MMWFKKPRPSRDLRKEIEDNRLLIQQRRTRYRVIITTQTRTRFTFGEDEYIVSLYKGEGRVTMTYVLDKNRPWTSQDQHHLTWPLEHVLEILEYYVPKEEEKNGD